MSERYQAHDRHLYTPDIPCPRCGRTDNLTVEWVDATTAEESARGERWYVAGILECHNHTDDCPRRVG